MIIEGNVSVKAAIMGGRRKVTRIYVDGARKDKDTQWILHRAEERRIPVEHMKSEQINALATGRTHGGILANALPRNLQPLSDLCTGKNPFLVLAEGIEDPFNLGYIMRTLYSAGCDGLILRKRNWESAESTILKSSAGAFEYLNIFMSDDPAATIRNLKKQGIKAYAAMRKNAIPYDQADYHQPVLVAVGGEMRGLSASVRREMDQNIYIPYANDFRNALNAAAAAAVLSYEVFRQRRTS